MFGLGVLSVIPKSKKIEVEPLHEELPAKLPAVPQFPSLVVPYGYTLTSGSCGFSMPPDYLRRYRG
jgi:hypothetical protein